MRSILRPTWEFREGFLEEMVLEFSEGWKGFSQAKRRGDDMQWGGHKIGKVEKQRHSLVGYENSELRCLEWLRWTSEPERGGRWEGRAVRAKTQGKGAGLSPEGTGEPQVSSEQQNSIARFLIFAMCTWWVKKTTYHNSTSCSCAHLRKERNEKRGCLVL